MKYIALLLPLYLVACAGCGSNGPKPETVKLALNFPAGAHYTYSVDTKQSIRQQMAGMNSEISQHMQLLSSYKVGDAGSGRKRLSVSYDRFYISSSTNGGMTMEYDSQDSSRQPQELAGIGNMVRHPFSLVVDAMGSILSVSADTSVTGSPKQVPYAGYSDSSIRQMMEQSLSIYPPKPVKPGDVWRRNFSTNLAFMEMTVESDYKLVSVANGIAHVEITAAIKSKPSSNPQMKDMQMEMQGTQTGTMDIAVKTGLVQDSYFSQHVKGVMHIPGADIPMELSSDTRIMGRMK